MTPLAHHELLLVATPWALGQAGIIAGMIWRLRRRRGSPESPPPSACDDAEQGTRVDGPDVREGRREASRSAPTP